jgi:hypothetical protein
MKNRQAALSRALPGDSFTLTGSKGLKSRLHFFKIKILAGTMR